jgi:hypothetical protein
MPEVSITDPASPPPYDLPRVEGTDVVLLPMYLDGDQAIYADGTTMAVKQLRTLGARAEWAHDAVHRSWYGERGAGEIVVPLSWASSPVLVGMQSNCTSVRGTPTYG